MKYAVIADKSGKVIRRVAAEPKGWGLPYQNLFDQTNVSGYDLFLVESHNNFDNDFQKELENLYQQRIKDDKGGFGLILRDIVRNGGRGTDDKGRLHLTYVSHANMGEEKKRKVWWPANGYWVPTKDGIFVPGTLCPFETVEDREEAIRRLEKIGIPKEFVSYSFRLDDYNEDMFVGRWFIPDLDDDGRFGVDASRPPSSRGDVGVASLPIYEEPKALLRVQVQDKKSNMKKR